MSETMQTALTTAFTGIKTDVLDAMGTALPIALAVVAAGLGIMLAVKFFKRIASKA